MAEAPKLPFPLSDQHVPTVNLDSDAAHVRLLYPFLPEYVGLRDPYTGELIRSSADYERYLREHCYYERCAREVHSMRIKLEDALGENLQLASAASRKDIVIDKNRKLLAENDSLREKAKQKELQASRACSEAALCRRKRRNSRALNVLLFLVILFLVFALITPSSQGSSSRGSSGKNYASSSRTYNSNSNSGYSSTRSTVRETVKKTEAIPLCYIGNRSTHKVHRSDCSYLPNEENRVYYDDLEDALAAGYEPCQRCHPR